MKNKNHSSKYQSLLILLVIGFTFVGGSLFAQDISLTREKLNVIAKGILKDATFQFTDQKTGIKYTSTTQAPPDADLKIDSPYNDWRYWNGVLNIAMMNLANAMSDSSYKEFVHKNIAFTFDNYLFFKTRNQPEGKWNLPFGQFITMEELDDCGAMGGSVIEVFKNDKQERYEDYINKAADHILNKQVRLKDGTL